MIFFSINTTLIIFETWALLWSSRFYFVFKLEPLIPIIASLSVINLRIESINFIIPTKEKSHNLNCLMGFLICRNDNEIACNLSKEGVAVRDVVNKSLAEGIVTEDFANEGKAYGIKEVR